MRFSRRLGASVAQWIVNSSKHVAASNHGFEPMSADQRDKKPTIILEQTDHMTQTTISTILLQNFRGRNESVKALIRPSVNFVMHGHGFNVLMKLIWFSICTDSVQY
ncbi:hypothetical protein PoB_006478100 [Plakobranchus ocellatus]|uniref:Uncharacterized protein n=1 Tax=Plakobranchus ocellatus TaxID=259542 RepID=A0AAV4D271_9GAST|nr:hypothetical protein PoB_006478100 [Plakobranchus ocellatus]